MGRNYLVVDDDQAVGLFLTTILADRGECKRANNAHEAMEVFGQALSVQPFDAVFMDIMLPDLDGHQIVELMRDMERRAGVPEKKAFALIMITALDDADNVSRAYYKNQASGYLVKPFTQDRVLEELRRAGLA